MNSEHTSHGQPVREMGLKQGTVLRAEAKREGVTEVQVQVCGETLAALAYPLFSGELKAGDEVLLNTTGLDLQLGSGGMHFVLANLSKPQEASLKGPGHIMKLRYTPLQFKSHSLEEAYQDVLGEGQGLDGMAVLALELHSMLLPAAFAIKSSRPHSKLVYIMTDGGSLPLALSEQVLFLKKQGLIDATITAGHAFGGDLEAVNMYTALQGARHILKGDACIAAMGPGILGTGTAFGFSGIEQGENINRVNILGGKAITCLRLSFADTRERHRGASHHSLTSLGKAALTPAVIALPEELTGDKRQVVLEQLKREGLPGVHTIRWHPVAETLKGLQGLPWEMKSMGRTVSDDPLFFAAAAAAGVEALKYID